MKKIHITEEQLTELKKKLSEAVAVDATKEVEAAGGNIKNAWNGIKSKNPTLSQQASSGEITLSVNPDGIDEGKFTKITKGQIKEARLKYLKENSIVYKKGNLK